MKTFRNYFCLEIETRNPMFCSAMVTSPPIIVNMASDVTVIQSVVLNKNLNCIFLKMWSA